MHTKMTGYFIALVVGIAIGALSVIIGQLQSIQVPATNSLSKIKTTDKPPVFSSAKMIIPENTSNGTVVSINGDTITIEITGSSDNAGIITQEIRLFPDTNIQYINSANPAEPKQITANKIKIGQQIQATGKIDDTGILFSNYMVVISSSEQM